SAGGPGGPGGPLLIGVRLQRGADREEVLVAVRSAIAELRGALPPRLELVERPPPPGQRARPPLVAGLRGPDRAVLRTIAVKLEAELRASNGISEIVRDPPLGEAEQTIRIDRDRAAQLGISSGEVAAAARAALGAGHLGALRSEGGRTRELVLRLDGSPTELLARVTVRAPRGELVPLSTIAAATTTVGEHLLRLDREPAIELSAYVAPGQP